MFRNPKSSYPKKNVIFDKMAACDCIINQHFLLPEGFDSKDTDIVVDAGSGSGRKTGFLVPNLKTTYSVIVEDDKGRIFLRHGTYTVLRQIQGKLCFVSPKIDSRYHKIPIDDLDDTIKTMIVEWELEKPGKIITRPLQLVKLEDDEQKLMIIVNDPFTDVIVDLKSPHRTVHGYRQVGNPMPIRLFKLFVVCYPGFIVDKVRPKSDIVTSSEFRVFDQEKEFYIGTSGPAIGVVFRIVDGVNRVVGFGPRLIRLTKRQVVDLMINHPGFVIPHTTCQWFDLEYEPASPHAQYRTVSRGPLAGLIVEIKGTLIFAVGMNEKLGSIPPKIVEIIEQDYHNIVVFRQ